MKSFITILMLFFFGLHFCKAQDSTVTLSPTMFDKDDEEIFISAMDGWLFKEGNDTSWAKKDIDIAGWKKLKPAELSAKYADKNGKAEGWFRIKIKLDTTFENKPFGFRYSTWAATDFYIDGNLIASFGNTGKNGTPFQEFSPFNKFPVSVNLKPGNKYTIALHFVDYVAPLTPLRLKSEDIGLRRLLMLTGPDYNTAFLRGMEENNFYFGIWISVSFVLSLLFWLLSIQNPFEKSLRLIAIYSTIFTLQILFGNLGLTRGSYVVNMIYNYAGNIMASLAIPLIPFILANIFKRKVSKTLKIVLITCLLASIVGLFLPTFILSSSCYCISIAVSIYYIISSWKSLKGAQWAIVAGLLFSMLSGTLLFAMILFYDNSFFPHALLYVTGYYLSLPLGMLVYVAMRFKEIIKEVEANAQQVLSLSEEKKEQALNQQKILQTEVTRQTAEIRTTLDNLKSTQAQLIQSEKMASLGELTAGIAHEIQNPLNFVNNFSEVNKELIDELKTELATGNQQQAIEIADDIKENEEKINHHGKRADAIVKGMLQHSRSSSGQKEPTDINALCDEYLRLSYHGMRAKDKNFNADFKTDFDETIGKIDIVPQDIGRVLLNLYNNAFYAVSEKKKQAGENYEPTVSISTKHVSSPSGAGGVIISVRDNGNGIPQNIVDKIFQPFFTTKPTGEGTGLGLSLSYDIIKAHGGEIKVESKEDEGTTFIIQLTV